MTKQNNRDNSREDVSLISTDVDTNCEVLKKQVPEEKKNYDWEVVEID